MTSVFERPVFARARRLCLAFPETTETSSWSHPNFRVGRKTFCCFETVSGQPSIAFRLAPGGVAAALRRQDFFATPYGRGMWASMWMDGPIDWKLIEALLEQSYRFVASKRLLTALDIKRGA